jgi:hypothetical protein
MGRDHSRPGSWRCCSKRSWSDAASLRGVKRNIICNAGWFRKIKCKHGNAMCKWQRKLARGTSWRARAWGQHVSFQKHPLKIWIRLLSADGECLLWQYRMRNCEADREGARLLQIDGETGAARVLGRHPVTVYRWIENYKRCERLSVFLRKRRSDRGTGRLSSNVEKIIDTAIKSVYLTAEKPTMTAVTEEVYLQCFKNKIKKKPAPNTIRARILAVSDHLRVEKREGKKRAAEKYEPIKGTSPALIGH